MRCAVQISSYISDIIADIVGSYYYSLLPVEGVAWRTISSV